ncbi:MAG TPA: hypothetical protein VFN36_00020 [Solirubrobacteraceae bacterium]|nr:hypothetical protein [Solirubrobacteraceae bacterium]
MPTRTRGLAGVGAACLAALIVSGCGTSGSSSSASSAVTISGHTLTIYLSEPSDLATNRTAQDVVHAEQLAFSADAKEVSAYRLSLQTVRAGKLTDNARSAIVNPTTIAYLGEIAPGATDATVGITNALDVLQVSPTDNALELTDRTAAVPGGAKTFFESWSTYGRTLARMVPSGSAEARAQVAEMKAAGLRSLATANDGSVYGRAIADAVAADARAAGITAAAPSAAAAVFYGAQSPAAAARFFNRVAAADPRRRLFGPSSLNTPAFAAALSGAARRAVEVSIPGYLPRDLPSAGRTFVSAFRTAYAHAPNVEAVFGYEAMAALLHVLQQEGHAANDRTAVVHAFLKQHNVRSVLGTYSIDAAGNTSLDAFVFAHVRGGQLVPFVTAPTG